jgi:hypothetical protein
MQTLSRLTVAEIRFLRTEGKTRRQRRRNENIKGNVKYVHCMINKLIKE